VGFHQVLDRRLNGGGKQQRLAIGRHGRHDFRDGGKKAHVEHAVGFIQNQRADVAEIDEVASEKIEQAAGSRDEHLRAFANGLELHSLAESADRDGGANAGTRGHFGERFADLDGEFASWGLR
jgi:hypothetical protein